MVQQVAVYLVRLGAAALRSWPMNHVMLQNPGPVFSSVWHGVFSFRCPWLSERFSVAVPIYNGVIFLFVLANFCMATFMDPGIFPRGDYKCEMIDLMSDFKTHPMEIKCLIASGSLTLRLAQWPFVTRAPESRDVKLQWDGNNMWRNGRDL